MPAPLVATTRYRIDTGAGPLVALAQVRRVAEWHFVIATLDGAAVQLSTWSQLIVSLRRRPFDSALVDQRTKGLGAISGTAVDVSIPRSTWTALTWEEGQRLQVVWMDVVLSGLAGVPTSPTPVWVLEDAEGNRLFPVRVSCSLRGLP